MLAEVELTSDLLEGLSGELSDDHREVIQLHVIDELGHREIAERLGLSNDVVRARISRGLRLLAGRARSPAASRLTGLAVGRDGGESG